MISCILFLFFHGFAGGASSDKNENAEVGPSKPKQQRTLMDYARAEISWPSYKNIEQVPPLEKYIAKFDSSANAQEYLDSIISHSRVQSEVLLYDTLLIICRKACSGVTTGNVESFQALIFALRDLIGYGICMGI